MSTNWTRTLFGRRAPNRQTRRANSALAPRRARGMFVELLEDRVVPDGSVPSMSFSNSAITVNEGSLFTRSGKVLDFDDEAIALTTDVVGATITPPSFAAGTTTVFQNFTFSYTPANGDAVTAVPATKTLSATDGPINPLAISATFNVSVNNVTSVVTAPADQVAITGKPVQLNLGKLTDPGSEPGYTVEVDLDYDGFTFTTDQTIMLGAGSKSNYTLSNLNAGGFALAKTYQVAVRVTDDTATSSLATFNVVVSDKVTPTYANDDFVELNDTSGGGAGLQPGDEVDVDPGVGVLAKIYGYEAWPTIQEAVNVTASGGVVNVLAGKYAEAVTLADPISVVGPNEGVGIGKAPGVRGPEATITSPMPNLTGNGIALIQVSASNVSLDGLTLDGDNTGISGGVAVIGGGDSNARRGLLVAKNSTTLTNVSVINTRILNFYGRGLQYGVSPGEQGLLSWTAPPGEWVADGNIQDNLFDGIGDTPFSDGYSSLSFVSSPSFTGNKVQNTNVGPWYQFVYSAITPPAISGNDISVVAIGIGLNETASGPITVLNNDFAVSAADGLGAQLTGTAGGAVFTGNNFTGSSGVGSAGLYVAGNPLIASIAITVNSGMISGFETGIDLTNDGYFGPADDDATVTVNGTAISQVAGGNAIRVTGNTAGAAKLASVGLTGGTTITGAASGNGILLTGPNAKLTSDTLGDTVFTGFTSTSQFVSLEKTAYAGNTITGTAASYNGTAGSSLTRTSTPTGFDVEDRISHYLDSAAVGFVRTTPSTAFVTPSSGSIQRAVNISAPGGGDTAFVAAGTYAESVTVDRGLSLVGPNDAIGAGKSGFGIRVPEAIITSPLAMFGGVVNFQSTSTGLVNVISGGVTLTGFTLDGDNTGIGGGIKLIDGVTFGNAAEGVVVTGTGVGTVSLSKNIIQNFYGSGVRFGVDFDPFTGPNSTGTITDGTITNVGFDPSVPSGTATTTDESYGLYSFGSSAGISNTKVSVAQRAVYYDTTNLAAAAFPIAVTDNTISGIVRGLTFEEVLGLTPLVTVSNNNINLAANGRTGLALWNIYSAVGFSVSGNNITGAGGVNSVGISAYNVTTPTTVNGGAVGGFETGVLVTNELFATEALNNTSLTLSGVAVTANAGSVGVWVQDGTVASTKLANVTLSGGTTVVGTGGTGTGVLLDGPLSEATQSGSTISGLTTGINQIDGALTVTGGSIKANNTGINFAGGTAAVGGVSFARGGGSPNTTDILLAGASGFAFNAGITFDALDLYIDNQTATDYNLVAAAPAYKNDTTTYTAGALPDSFRIEDRIYHKTDVNTNGRVTFATNSVYITSPATLNGGGGSTTDSSIQGGIDAVPNGSSGWTVNVEAGSYDLAVSEPNDFVMVNEDVTVFGAGAASTTITRSAAASGGQTYLFGVASNGVTIQGFTFATVRPFANDGILAQYLATGVSGTNADTGVFDELLIQDNVFTATGTAGTGASVHTGGSGRGVPVALLDNSGTNHADVSLKGNWIKSGAETGLGGLDFTRGLWSYAPMLTIGGPALADGNKFYGTFQSALMQFVSITPSLNSTMLVQNNTFTGNVAEVTEPNSNVNVLVTNNTFGINFGTRGNFFVNHNYSTGATVTISDNVFTVADNTLGVFLGGSKAVTVEDNTFNAVTGATNFAYVVADSQFRNGTNSAASVSNFVIQGNVFNGGSVAGGTGIALYNGNSSVGFDGAIIGGAGADANSFGANLAKFITLNNVRNPIMTPEGGGSPVLGAFDLDINIADNTFDVGSGQQLPSVMTLTGKFDLEEKLTHKPDLTALGLLTFAPNTVYVPNTQTIQGGINATPVAGVNWKVYVESGTYDEDVAMAVSSVDRVGLQVLGEGAGTTTIRGVVGGPGLTISIGANQTIDGFTITRVDPANTPGENTIALSNIAGATGFVVSNNVFTQNRTAIYVTDSGQGTITRNTIDNNRTGILFVESNNGAYLISENYITNNRTFGILFGPGAAIISPSLLITNNSITGNFATQLENNSPVAVNAPGNWFGSNSLTTYSGSLNSDKLAAGLDGNGNPFSWSYPGPAVAPGSPMPYSVSGTNLGNTDFTPYLWAGTDTAPGTNGFQGDFSELVVTTQGGQIQVGGRINEAVGFDSLDAGPTPDANLIHVLPGTYVEAVDLNRDSVTVRLEGAATINSLAAATGTDRKVDLNGYALNTGDGTDTVFNGVFVGVSPGSLVKQGVGKFTVAGDSSGYTGGTSVSAGILELTGKLGGTIGVGASGTLSGTGTVDGLLTNNGVVSPGSPDTAVGTLKAYGGYTQSSSGTLRVLATSAGVNDVLDVHGAVSVDGTLDVNFGTYVPASYSSTVFLTNDSTDAIGGAKFSNFTTLNTPSSVSSPVLNLTIGGTSYPFLVAYGAGIDSNDFALIRVPAGLPVGYTFANKAWTGIADGTIVPGDADPVAPGVQPIIIGYSGYDDVQTALNATATSGTLSLYAHPMAYGNLNFDTVSSTNLTVRLVAGSGITATVGDLIDDMAVNGTGTVNLNRFTMAAGTAAGTLFSGKLTGPGTSSIVKQGSGTLTLTNPANDYKGSTTVSNGTLAAGADEVIPDGSLVSVAATGTLSLGGYVETIGGLAGSAGAAVLLGTDGELYIGANNQATTFAGAVSGAGSIVKVGTGTLTLSGANTHTGSMFMPIPTNVYSGVLEFANGGSVAGQIDSTGGTVAINGPAALGNQITGTGGVEVRASTTLSGTNTYTGGTTVAGGILNATGDGPLGATSGVVTVGSGGTVSLGVASYTGRTFNLASGATLSAAGAITLVNTNVSGGALTGPGAVTSDGSTFTGVTIASATSVSVAGAASTFTNGSNNGTITVPTGATANMISYTNAAAGNLYVYGEINATGVTTHGYVQVSQEVPGTPPGGKITVLGTAPFTLGSGALVNIAFDTATIGGMAGTTSDRRNRGSFYLQGTGGINLASGAILRNNGLLESPGSPHRVVTISNGAYYRYGDSALSTRVNVTISALLGGSSKGGFVVP